MKIISKALLAAGTAAAMLGAPSASAVIALEFYDGNNTLLLSTSTAGNALSFNGIINGWAVLVTGVNLSTSNPYTFSLSGTMYRHDNNPNDGFSTSATGTVSAFAGFSGTTATTAFGPSDASAASVGCTFGEQSANTAGNFARGVERLRKCCTRRMAQRIGSNTNRFPGTWRTNRASVPRSPRRFAGVSMGEGTASRSRMLAQTPSTTHDS